MGVKAIIQPACGTPQGGVLSSRVWNLDFDPLLKLLNANSPCSPVGFADDGALCFVGICPHTLIQIAQPFLDNCVKWGAQNGFTFSVDKTTAVFFTNKYNFHNKEIKQVKKLTMNGFEITPQDSMTYLGVVLDNKLNWNKHIQTKLSKCKTFLAMLRPAIKQISGLSPKKSPMDLGTNDPSLTDIWVSCLGSFSDENSDLIYQKSCKTCSCLLCPHVEVHTYCWFINYSKSKAPSH